MKKAIAKMSVWLVGPWSRLGPRDRRMLVLLAAVLLAVLLWQGLWQPAQVRLAGAERQFQQHWELAREISTASPQSSRASAPVGPAQVSETVAAAGLELEQLNVDASLVRLTLRGDPLALLTWLEGMERRGAILQNLVLEKRAAQLEASLGLELP
jgi:general secretion pathway protein M